VTRDAVLAQRDMILALRGKVQKLVDQGKTLDEIIATHPTADIDARVPGGTPATADRFVKWVYTEVLANR
jgi:cyclase